ITFDDIAGIAADAPLHCADARLEPAMIAEIDRAREAGDTLGGSFEVIAHNVPPGLGSYVQWDRKLDGRLAQAIMSIPAIKAVGIGRGPAGAPRPRPRRHHRGRRGARPAPRARPPPAHTARAPARRAPTRAGSPPAPAA